MSILIEGLEMPSCEVGYRAYMDFRIWNDGTVEARIGPKETEYNAVTVQAHGRLIDADALKCEQQKDADLYRNATTITEKARRDEALNAVANIVNAPTIIPADPAEEVKPT